MDAKQGLSHPSDELLAAFGDPSLGVEAQERLALHLDSCPDCRTRQEQLEPVFVEYRRCLEAVHAQIQRPRQQNAVLAFPLPSSTPAAPRRSGFGWLAWAGSFAASALAGFLLFSWNGRASERQADGLLAQASVAPPPGGSRQLRIRTQAASFLRPALFNSEATEESAAAQVRMRFEQANYDWRDPLSAQTYSAWRGSLKHKTSKVLSNAPRRQIETSTGEGTLRNASLTFDEKLAPVSGLFQFADQEWVEITAVTEPPPKHIVDVVAIPEPAPSGTAATGNRPRQPFAERELDVRLAIDALHAGASEPIEVSTGSGDILVTTYHLTAEQEARLGASLKPIDGVTLRALNENSGIQPDGASDATGLLLRNSQDVSFEAHLLSTLGARFPPAVEASLTGASKAKLEGMRQRHLRELTRDVATLQQKLTEANPEFHLTPQAPVSGAAPDAVDRLASTASALDRMIIQLSATDASKPERASILPQIAQELAQLHAWLENYTRHMGGPPKGRE